MNFKFGIGIVIYSAIFIQNICLNNHNNSNKSTIQKNDSIIKPIIVTDTVYADSDDPAIWINKKDITKSFILGTDKDNKNGGVYAFDLNGKIIKEKTITGLKRVNNIDISYGFLFLNRKIDIAVATERGSNSIRVFSLPDMKIIDGGKGIPVFEDEMDEERKPMGIALYKNPTSQLTYAIVSRKDGKSGSYLYQYLLTGKNGIVIGKLVRKFGEYSGKKEIESIAVDNELGYVYYSDEQCGIRKYFADPAKGNKELALFGKGDFKEDNEGISIYKVNDSTGYILVSDQSANKFNIYPREGTKSNKNNHPKIAHFYSSTKESDGSDVTAISLPNFKGGLFVAMSTDKTFQYYRWTDIANQLHLQTRKK